MRCVLIGPVYPYRGGIAHYTTMLCQALRERGHEVLMISFKRQYPQWLFPGRSDKDPSKRPLKVEDARYWIDSLNPITWLATFQRMRRYRPDVVILQWWTTFWAPVWFVLGMLHRLFLRGPLVYICHNVLPHEVRWWDPWLARWVLRWGTWFVVQSEEEERRLLSLLPGVKTAVIPMPVFNMLASERVSKKEARRRLGLPLDVPVLLFFGIVREYKGLKDLLMALPEIRARLGKVMLVVAGEFWEDKRSYLEMIQRLGIGDSVIVEDCYIPNEEVPLYFSAADALVAPYRRVTGSAVLQLARGFGLPVIMTTGGIASTITIADEKVENTVLLANSRALVTEVVRFFAEGPRPGDAEDAGIHQMSSWDNLVDRIVGGIA